MASFFSKIKGVGAKVIALSVGKRPEKKECTAMRVDYDGDKVVGHKPYVPEYSENIR